MADLGRNLQVRTRGIARIKSVTSNSSSPTSSSRRLSANYGASPGSEPRSPLQTPSHISVDEDSYEEVSTLADLGEIHYEELIAANMEVIEKDEFKDLTLTPKDDLSIVNLPRQSRTLNLPEHQLSNVADSVKTIVDSYVSDWTFLEQRYSKYATSGRFSEGSCFDLDKLPHQRFEVDIKLMEQEKLMMKRRAAPLDGYFERPGGDLASIAESGGKAGSDLDLSLSVPDEAPRQRTGSVVSTYNGKRVTSVEMIAAEISSMKADTLHMDRLEYKFPETDAANKENRTLDRKNLFALFLENEPQNDEVVIEEERPKGELYREHFGRFVPTLHQHSHNLYQQSLTLYQQCLTLYQQCLTLYQQCLTLYQQCLTLYQQSHTFYQQSHNLYQQSLTLYQQCLTLYQQ
eukprot:Colp12_sorted_trinity150504_noHs@4370